MKQANPETIDHGGRQKDRVSYIFYNRYLMLFRLLRHFKG